MNRKVEPETEERFASGQKRAQRHFEQKLRHATYEDKDSWEDQDYSSKEIFHRNKGKPVARS